MNPNLHSNSVNSLRSDRSATSGFTLVEILAVLAVIAAIIAIGVPAISKVLQNGRVRNAEGTASVLKSAITQYLSKPGNLGTLPVTETTAGTLPAAEFVNTAANTAAAGPAATLDNMLLTEGALERPINLRIGVQNATSGPGATQLIWSASTEQYSNAAAATANFTTVSRAEVGISDGATIPSLGTNAAACAFNLNGDGSTLIANGSRVAYLILKNVPDADAYTLALDVDGQPLIQNTANTPATAAQTKGPVVYAADGTGATNGYVDVYYYLTNL